MRGNLVANALSDSLMEEESRGRKLQTIFDRTVAGRAHGGHRLVRFGQGRAPHRALSRGPRLRAGSRSPLHATPACARGRPGARELPSIIGDAGLVGDLVLMHDLELHERRSQDMRLIILIASLAPPSRW